MGRRPALLGLLAALLLPPLAGAEAGWMFEPVFRTPRAGDVLHDGPPPLLRAQLDAFVDLLEAAFDLSVPASHEQRLRDALEVAYGRGNALSREGFAGLVAPLASLRQRARAGDRAGVEDGLSRFRRALDHAIAAEPQARAHVLVTEILKERQRTAWPGSPPVNGAAAGAWLEIAEFLASLGRNQDVVLTAGQRAELERDLSALLHGRDERVRRRVHEAHRLWSRVKAEWDAADTGRRTALRWAAVGLLGGLLPEERRIEVHSDGDLRAYARVAASLAGRETPFDAWANVAANPPLVLETLDPWLGPAPEGEDESLLYR
jgi:hypothetical protein